MGVPVQLQDDDAEDASNAFERMLLIVKRLFENPIIIVVVLVAISLVLATIMYALIVSDYVDEMAPDEGVTMNIREMDTFENVAYGVYPLSEGQVELLYSEVFHALQLPAEEGDIVICFIDRIVVAAHWTDETGDTTGLVPYENQPDTVAVVLTDSAFGLFDDSREATNAQGEEGVVEVSWEGDGHFIEESWLHEGDLTFLKMDGSAYVDVKGGEVHWNGDTDARVRLVEAGDLYHPFLPMQQADTGNEVIVEVTVSGYYHTLGPDDYDELVTA
jgi:hypothetical protein